MKTPQNYTYTKDIKTKLCPNQHYWINYQNKMVMGIIKDGLQMTLISNSSQFMDDNSWKPLEGRKGWITKDVDCGDCIFFDFNNN